LKLTNLIEELASPDRKSTPSLSSLLVWDLAATMIDQKAKERLEPILAEFCKGIVHHRAEGATEERIKQILAASIRLAVQQVEDSELCAWLCDEFSKAAKVAPIVTNYPASRMLH
jgi:hypothetical protein